jgi:hypothetical protein
VLDTVFWSGINFYEAVIDDVNFIGAVSERNAQGGTANTLTLAADASAIDDHYNQMQVEITSGAGSGRRRTIIDYDGTNKVATVDPAWGLTPNATSIYRLADTVSLTCQSGEDSVLVDFFEVSYPQQFVAYNDSLKFTHDSGNRYQITDFSIDALMVFDISDSDDVGQVIDFSTAGSDPYSLEFEPPVNPGASETFWVLRSDGWQTPAGLVEDSAADLGDIANGADYILITHRDLGWDGNGDAYGWLEDLAALRQAQGLRVEVIDVQDIFDEFSYGLFSPQAIKDFLSYAYANWDEPAASYVLLVGDSTYDPKDLIGLADATPYLPAYLAFTEYMGETVTDEWYVRISGGDAVPDMYIGRLPAASVADAEVMVAKIDAYEAAVKDKSWQGNVIFVADDETEDYEAIFKTMNDDAAALLPAAMGISAGYLDDYLTVNALTADIIGWINSGALLVNYSGHGNTDYWAAGPIFHVDDVASLTNADKYPFFVSMSCLSGHFAYPQPYGYYSLMEVLLRSTNKGAVAALMPTGKSTTGGQYILDTALFETIFSEDVRLLGPAIAQAKQTLLANGGSEYEELSETFLLFGDPALTLKIPLPRRPAGLAAKVTYESVALSWQPAADFYGAAVEGYNLYRSTSANGSYSLVNSGLISDTDFEDPTAEIGVTYYYVVSAVDEDADESVQSASVSALIGDSHNSDGLLALVPCFIGATVESIPWIGLWILAILTLAVVITHWRMAQGARHRVQGTGRTRA